MIQFLDALFQVDSSGAVAEVSQRIDQCIDLPLRLGLLFAQGGKLGLKLGAVARMGRTCLFQLLHKVAGMVGKVLDLFTDSGIKQIAVGVGDAAKLPAAALLQLAHIGKNHSPFCRFAPGDLGVHPATAGAPQQTGQQRLVAPGCVVGLGFVPLQRFLHPDPPVGGNDAGVFAHRNNPLVDQIFQDTLGGRPYLFNGGLPPGGSDGSGAPGIDYTVPAEALTDSEFASIYEETGALTSEGNLSLVDDYHTSYSDGSGQQFITLVSKSGATFYLVIDRNAKGQQTVHFMNLVDEADLLTLMEEEDAEAYTAEKEAVAQAELERKLAEEEAKKAAEEAAASGAEQPKENKITKYAAAFLSVLALVGLTAGSGIYAFMKQKQKKQAEKEALDPDADYTEDKGDFEIPMEDEPEEPGKEDMAEE